MPCVTHPLFPSSHSSRKESFTSLSQSSGFALFCAFFHFLAFVQNSTHFFSCASALFAKNTGGGGGAPLPIPQFFVLFPTSLPPRLYPDKLRAKLHQGASHV